METPDRPQIAPTPVRLPAEMKSSLKSEAKENGRSLNGEIVYRLRNSLPQQPAQ